MPHYPHTHLFLRPTTTTVISGPHIQVLDSSTGVIRHSVADPAGPVRCAAVDAQGKHLATAGDDKTLKVWKTEGMELVNQRELPKRPTAIKFTADGQTILTSDKFGDVFSYPFHYTPLTVEQKKDALASHANPSGGKLVLGHTSLLNAFLLTPDEKYIITADRDEHIRVSWFPQGYNIEMYCLGHTKFVSAIHNPPFAPSDLVSGGGDPMLKIWDWMTGTLKHEIRVWDAVEPYIRVRIPKRRRGEEDEEDSESRRKARGKKAEGKGKAKEAESPVETAAKEEEGVPAATTPTGPETRDTPTPGEEEKADKVLVIRKIDTVPSTRHVVFSAVGATALFTTPYPGDGTVPDVRAFDLGRPVLNFVVADDGLVWVSLDGNWPEATSEKPEKAFVRVLDATSGELAEATLASPLLDALNSAALQPASTEDLEQLDLYGDLSAMPKGHEPEEGGDASTKAEAPVTKRTIGRLRNKQAVLEKAQAMATATASTPAADDEVQEPSAKKTKSEHGDESRQDVDMVQE
ncbi:putative required for the formation of N(7)-methylguanine at position 46 (m7G46) in tRNA [Lyophyllum shimeji]|uniref:Required for the formation of N(7)-methylguanine at position 46 (M7G46) in tRNA n=1 Tax=Lyophyllum shimeji TaxID=47721 RepID=A0A9P3UQN4_LYOSH|nr:putative required for the formation of N(7)-methylguanine at position 46 (m7G46) in tRNA [Lyophyllum shimeji]